MEAVVADLVLHPEHDEQAAGHPDGQSDQVDGEEALVPPVVAERRFQVVSQHHEPP
jgi:hypothetical protein